MELMDEMINFSLPSTNGETRSLNELLKGSRGLVLTSFPLAFTGK